MCLPFVFNCSLWKRQQETHPSTKFQSSCRRFFQRKPKKHLVNSYCDCHVWLPTFYGKHILQRPQFVENIGLDMPHSHGNPMSRTALNLKRVAHKEGPSLVSGPPNILYIYIWSIWCSNKKGCTAILFIPICTERKKTTATAKAFMQPNMFDLLWSCNGTMLEQAKSCSSSCWCMETWQAYYSRQWMAALKLKEYPPVLRKLIHFDVVIDKSWRNHT